MKRMRSVIAAIVAGLLTLGGAGARTITADMNAVTGPRDMFWQDCVGAGHAALFLRQKNLDQLKMLHETTGFHYIRFHGIFSDDMGVYREDKNGNPVYDFSKVDLVYDALLKIGIRPFVEIGFMPDALAQNHQPIFYWKANGSPPKDWQKWAGLITAFTRHLENKFGTGEVRHWRFEIWNEPNLKGFWNPATQDSYFQLYDTTVKAMKAVDEKLPVGGPATAGAAWVPAFLAHAKDADVPVDFITTHAYGVSRGYLDAEGNEDNKLSPDPNAILSEVWRVRAEVARAGKPNIPVYFTEWNSSYSPRDSIHDSYFNAAYVLEKLKGAEGFLQSMSYWAYSDLFEEAGPPPTPFHGGFGLINRSGIPKPTFFAYKYLAELGPTTLKDNDAHSWVTKDGNAASALIWNFVLPQQKESNRPYFTTDHPPLKMQLMTLQLRDLAPGRYRLKTYRTGYRRNDPQTNYLHWGMPQTLTHAQQRILIRETADKPYSSETITVRDDRLFSKQFRLRENDILLVKLTPTL